jgi:hypothetical protein
MRAVGYAVALVCFIAAEVIAGASEAEKSAMNEVELKVAQVARDYVATRFPDFDLAGSPPIVTSAFATNYVVEFSGAPPAEFTWPPQAVSLVETWTVEYLLPEGRVGGTPVVIIDKRTLKVLKAYHTQ